MFELMKSDTFWSAVSALATLAGAAAIGFAVWQLRFEAWLKAQEIWVSDDFTADRGKVFARLDHLQQEEEAVGLKVCRRVDEFVSLAPYLGGRRMLKVWGDPLAKAWLVLEPLVRKERERTAWPTKWDAFEKFGTKALGVRPHLQAKQQEAKHSSRQEVERRGGKA